MTALGKIVEASVERFADGKALSKSVLECTLQELYQRVSCKKQMMKSFERLAEQKKMEIDALQERIKEVEKTLRKTRRPGAWMSVN
jgi:tRNA A-37 threonylcarbamoyl transferase component Bud32